MTPQHRRFCVIWYSVFIGLGAGVGAVPSCCGCPQPVGYYIWAAMVAWTLMLGLLFHWIILLPNPPERP